MDVTSTALSGLNAAERRLANSATNIANANTPGFTATDVQQTPQETGGVRTDVVAREQSNVDVAEELVNAQNATYDFQANLQVMKKQRELDKSLLDIQA